MASRKIIFGSKPTYIYPTGEFDDGVDLINNPSSDHHNVFEFDEADVWNNSNEAATTIQDGKKPLPSSRPSSRKPLRKMEVRDNHRTANQKMAAASSSLPLNIPDWSEILKAEYRGHGVSDEDIEDDYGDRDGRVPPHEYLARRRGASFSVHEGIGRTLKGRDLRRVRNAVWKKTGFED